MERQRFRDLIDELEAAGACDGGYFLGVLRVADTPYVCKLRYDEKGQLHSKPLAKVLLEEAEERPVHDAEVLLSTFEIPHPPK